MPSRKEPEVPEKEQLLSEENHPIDGNVQRWRCSDGQVWVFAGRKKPVLETVHG